MPGTLYLVPSGLGDAPWECYLAPRTHGIATQLSHYIAENARTARAELKRLGHPLPLRDIRIAEIPQQLDAQTIETLLAPLHSGTDIGLMSEAGCPAVADPGALLVRRTHELGIRVVPLVGPSSILLGLMASGLDGQRFAFHGYLPARDPERGKRIQELEKESARLQQTQIFIEAPYRNRALFDALLARCQPRTRLCLATDLTLDSEQVTSLEIAAWRKREAPAFDKRPTIFLLLSAA